MQVNAVYFGNILENDVEKALNHLRSPWVVERDVIYQDMSCSEVSIPVQYDFIARMSNTIVIFECKHSSYEYVEDLSSGVIYKVKGDITYEDGNHMQMYRQVALLNHLFPGYNIISYKIVRAKNMKVVGQIKEWVNGCSPYEVIWHEDLVYLIDYLNASIPLFYLRGNHYGVLKVDAAKIKRNNENWYRMTPIEYREHLRECGLLKESTFTVEDEDIIPIDYMSLRKDIEIIGSELYQQPDGQMSSYITTDLGKGKRGDKRGKCK